MEQSQNLAEAKEENLERKADSVKLEITIQDLPSFAQKEFVHSLLLEIKI